MPEIKRRRRRNKLTVEETEEDTKKSNPENDPAKNNIPFSEAEITESQKTINNKIAEIAKLELEIATCNATEEELRKTIGKKAAQLQRLNFGINQKLTQGTDLYVTLHWALEIIIYLRILHIARIDAKKSNKGQRSQYPYLYTTNQQRLIKQFRISQQKAARFLNWFTASGAAIEIKKTPGNQFREYELGHRMKRYVSDRKTYNYFDRLHFNLGSNSKPTSTRRFYKNEKKRLGIPVPERKKKAAD